MFAHAVCFLVISNIRYEKEIGFECNGGIKSKEVKSRIHFSQLRMDYITATREVYDF